LLAAVERPPERIDDTPHQGRGHADARGVAAAVHARARRDPAGAAKRNAQPGPVAEPHHLAQPPAPGALDLDAVADARPREARLDAGPGPPAAAAERRPGGRLPHDLGHALGQAVGQQAARSSPAAGVSGSARITPTRPRATDRSPAPMVASVMVSADSTMQ